MEAKKKSVYRAAPISEEVLEQLEKRYGIPVEELKRIAKENNFGRPKLEMHLLFLKLQSKHRLGNA